MVWVLFIVLMNFCFNFKSFELMISISIQHQETAEQHQETGEVILSDIVLQK